MKKFLRILAVISALFLVYNAVWAVLVLPKYKEFKNVVGYDEQRKRWYCREGDYTYSVSSPGYLSYSGNRSANAFNVLYENGYPHVTYVKFGYDDFVEEQEEFTPQIGKCPCLAED